MMSAFKDLVEKRKELKERVPQFKRVNAARFKKLEDKGWRKPRGRHNKIRKSIKGAGNKVRVGYGTPKEMRHLHPSGYKEVIVYNLKDLENVNKDFEGIRIASSVGLKKRIMIIESAMSQGIKVFNPNIKSRIEKRGYHSLKELKEVHGKGLRVKKKKNIKEVDKKQEEDNKEDKESQISKDNKENKEGDGTNNNNKLGDNKKEGKNSTKKDTHNKSSINKSSNNMKKELTKDKLVNNGEKQ